VSAVVTHFLLPVVGIWTSASYWTCFNIIAARKSAVSNYCEVTLKDALANMVHCPEICARLLTAFRRRPCTGTPKIGRFAFQDGVRFAPIRLDAFLMQSIVTSAHAVNRRLCSLPGPTVAFRGLAVIWASITSAAPVYMGPAGTIS
jgi:hypothetical protein